MIDNPWKFRLDGEAIADDTDPEEILLQLMSRDLSDALKKYFTPENNHIHVAQSLLLIGVEMIGAVLAMASPDDSDAVTEDLVDAIRRIERSIRSLALDVYDRGPLN